MKEWCDCGRPLNAFGFCPRHKDRIKKFKKETKKRFSGRSNSEFAFNEYK